VQTITFNSLARKEDTKSIKIENPSEKDWYLTPSVQGDDWKVPHELKVPAKGSAELSVTYFPLTMTTKAGAAGDANANAAQLHTGQMFLALPDGSARLYKLEGTSGEPLCAGQVAIETPAKKACTTVLKVCDVIVVVMLFWCFCFAYVLLLNCWSGTAVIFCAIAVLLLYFALRRFALCCISLNRFASRRFVLASQSLFLLCALFALAL
jgi:hypothetical protein